MSKFPLLNLYSNLATIGAFLVALVGVMVAIGAGSMPATFGSRDAFNFGLFLTTLIPFLITAFGLGVAGEFIKLAVRVEDHLDRIRAAHETNTKPANASWLRNPTAANPAAPAAYRPTSAPTDKKVYGTVAVERYTLRSVAGAGLGDRGNVTYLQSVLIIGRTRDDSWLKVSATDPTTNAELVGWLPAATLNVQGTLEDVPFTN